MGADIILSVRSLSNASLVVVVVLVSQAKAESKEFDQDFWPPVFYTTNAISTSIC